MTIHWLEHAVRDLEDLFNYLIERNPQAASQQYQTIRQKVELLAEQPGLGRPGRVQDTRELIIAGTPYIVAYTVDRDRATVIILCVLHSARQWPQDFS